MRVVNIKTARFVLTQSTDTHSYTQNFVINPFSILYCKLVLAVKVPTCISCNLILLSCKEDNIMEIFIRSTELGAGDLVLFYFY